MGYLRHEDTADPVAPWWPFPPGPLPELPIRPVDVVTPEPAHAVLDTLEPLGVSIGATPFVELLRPAYDVIVRP